MTARSRARTQTLRGPVPRALLMCALAAVGEQSVASEQFKVEEATIAGLHAAIKSGDTTCVQVVQAYIDRAKAYNGVCTALVTAGRREHQAGEGLRARGQAAGVSRRRRSRRRRSSPTSISTRACRSSTAAWRRTISDPSVWHADGHARRHSRRRADQRARDAEHPRRTLGHLQGQVRCASVDRTAARGRAGGVRGIPPAARCARARRRARCASTARNPDLAALPMYCVVAAFKDPYDTKDMRTTSNNDVELRDGRAAVRFDARRAAARQGRDHLREVGRARIQRAAPAIRAAPNKAKLNWVAGGQQISALERPALQSRTTPSACVRGSSGGSGAAVGGNLATIGICEQSGASCQGPASRNGIALILTTKGIIPDSGGIGNQWFNDRAGIHARTLGDAAKVLDAMKDPVTRLLRSARSVHRVAEGARFPSSRTRASRSATRR